MAASIKSLGLFPIYIPLWLRLNKVAELVNKEIKFGYNPDNVEFLDIIEK